MALMASRTNFLPDGNLLVRTNGAAVLNGDFSGAAISLGRLTGYWRTNEVGAAEVLQFAITIEAIALLTTESYEFLLEIDDNASFSSATKVASQILSTAAHAGTLPLSFDLDLERAAILGFDPTASYVRLRMDSNGVAETGTITFATANAADGDTVTINDGVHTAVVFTFGDGTGGTVDKGANQTASAQNLKAAIAVKVAANLLSVSVAGGAAVLTVTNTAANTGGTISEVGVNITRTQFTGGLSVPIQFWACVRGTQGKSC